MRVEQALFTSVRGERLDGYQLAATSAGISADLARRITPWGPAHDSLLDQADGATSINFHTLTDEWFALSKTIRQGEEYSGRGGGRIVTQFFLLDHDTLGRFANHPLAVLRALVAGGRTRVPDPIPARLPSFALVGRAVGWNSSSQPGDFDAQSLDMLAELVRHRSPAVVVCSEPADVWLKALYSRLDCQDRLLLSFTTGLRPTACRPFLVSAMPDDPALVRQSQRMGGAVVHLSPLAFTPSGNRGL